VTITWSYSNTDSGMKTTMNDYVDAEHVCQLMVDGKLEKHPATVAAEAEEYLKTSFPLHTRTTTWVVDWDSIPSTLLCWMKVNDEEARAWAGETVAGRCSLGLLHFSADQPCLVGSFDFLIMHLDELVWQAPGNRLLFGVERKDGGGVLFNRGVIEFNGRGELRGSL